MTNDNDDTPNPRHLDLFQNALYRHGGRMRRGELTRFVAGRMLVDEMDAVADHLRAAGLIAVDIEIVRGKEARLYRWIARDDLAPAPRKQRDAKQVRHRTDAYTTLNESIRAMTESMNALRDSIDRLTAYTRGEA